MEAKGRPHEEPGVLLLCAKQHLEPQEGEEVRKDCPQNLQREHDPADSLVSDFRPWTENTFLLIYTTQLVVICYSNPEKLIYLAVAASRAHVFTYTPMLLKQKEEEIPFYPWEYNGLSLRISVYKLSQSQGYLYNW
jgi:hypothetical protein